MIGRLTSDLSPTVSTLDPNLNTVAVDLSTRDRDQGTSCQTMSDKVYSRRLHVGSGADYLFHAGETHGIVIVATFFGRQERFL